MSKLIWFSIPGTIFMWALAFVFPLVLDSEAKAALAIAATLPIGFTIHQVFRTLFEWRYGWELPSRNVIGQIKGEYKLTSDKRLTSDRKAFLVWEMTLYSNKIEGNDAEISEAFRRHNRDSWHYVLSFWSCSFSAFISFLVVFGWGLRDGKVCTEWALMLSALLFLALVFIKKGYLTYLAINEQEEAAFKLYRNHFDRIAEGLGYKKPTVLEVPVIPRSKFWGFLLGLFQNF